MGVFLRVFDPKGFRNPYTGSDWRSVGRQKVEPIEAVGSGHTPTQLQAFHREPAQARVSPPEPGEDSSEDVKEKQQVDPGETTLERAKQPSDLEKEITQQREFYGPGQLTGIAADVMEKGVPAIKSSDPVSEASKILKRHQFSNLPVITSQNTICGLITENQIFFKLVEEEVTKEELDKSKVNEWMISPVLCCLMGTPISILIQTILEEKVGCIPVVDSQDRFQGVVTKKALLRYIFESSHFFDNMLND